MEFCDEYDHIYNNTNVIYTPENIPSKATKDQFQEIATGCSCISMCTVETGCSCLHNYLNYIYDLYITEETIDSIKENYKVIKSETPIYECNLECSCSAFCGNRLAQYGPRKNLKIISSNNSNKKRKAQTKSKGAGLFTSVKINKGNFICEYAGEVISHFEANERFKRQEKNNSMNYIFCLNETFGSNVIKTFVDPSVFGNIGRYINHSCDPNSEVIPVRINCIIPKLCIFAIKDIEPDEEITFDYGDGDLGFSPTDDTVEKKKRCLCDYVNCRKYLPFCKNA